MMYDDKDIWKKHYQDWKKIYPTVTNDYRKKLFERLIKEYEEMSKMQ